MAQRQRKGPPEQTGGGNGIFYGVLGVVALGGLVAIGYALLGGATGSAATEVVELDITDPGELYARATPVRLGAADAPVRIVEFGDFQCPGCGTFSLRSRPYVVDNYVKNGQVQFTFYDFPLVSIHDHAFLAARAARCAGDQTLPTPAGLQGVPGEANAAYWIYHDKLFEEQESWAYASGSLVDDFVGYAADVGLDEDAFESCLRSDRHAEVVSANKLLAEQLRLRGTPTVIVNQRRVEDWRPAALGAVIEEALRSAAPTEQAEPADGDDETASQ